MENYIVLEMIGEGAFGKVYKGQRKSTNQIVAIKKIIKKGKKEKDLKNLRQEIDISRRLYHENIVQLLDSFETSTEFCLVSELCTGQLFEVIEEDKRLPEPEIRRIAQQLSSALFYLHNNNIIHRDIKPQNILINANGVIKLCDFGFARFFDNKTMITSIKGTPLYMAPELLKETPYNKKADLWSLGVILYELYVGQPPFYTNSFPTLMNKIMKEDIRYPDSMSQLFKEFLKGLLCKKPKERWDWDKILAHPYLKENEQEKKEKFDIQDNYRKWIIRLKNDKIFNLYESESFFAKFANDIEVENNTKNFSTFDINDSKTTTVSKNPNAKNNKDDDYWTNIENKSNNEEGATGLRKDAIFAEKVISTLKNVINEENNKISDKKIVGTITKIILNILTKGKFDNQNIDITKNKKILSFAISIFISSQQEEIHNPILNDVIKIIGLFIKFFCYNLNGIDLSICNGFLKYVPNVLNTPGRQPSIYINMLKSVGLMITAANIAPKKSFLFYKSIIDFNIINTLLQVIKNYKAQQFVLTKSCLECLVILIHPVNGDVNPFPLLRNENPENRFDGYNEVKTAFSHIELLKKHILTICISEKYFDIFPSLYDYENDNTIKIAILKIILQLLRYNPKEMFIYLNETNNIFIKLINTALECDDINKKLITQLGLLILIELVKYASQNKNINLINYGYKIQNALNYLNKTFQLDNVTLCLTFGLLSEWVNIDNNYSNIYSTKYLKLIKDTIRNFNSKGKDENKRLEGTSFGYLSISLFDYPLLYLEKIFQLYISKDKYKSEIINSFAEIQFEDILIEIISNSSSLKNEISPIGLNSVLIITNYLIGFEYKNVIKKVIREYCMKQLIILIKKKQLLAIQDWPGYKNEDGIRLSKSIFITALKIIKRSSELNGISEEIAKTDFFYNLKTSFEIITKEHYKTVVGILNTLISVKRDENVWTLLVNYFSKSPNIKFIQNYGILKELQNKELISDILSFLSGLCRKSAEVYEAIHQLNIFPELKNILETSNEPLYKSRVCNLLGNMCRHTDYFYDEIKKSGILVPLLKCCYDNDKATRKFACFAIGNAAFLNDKLYENFKGIIARLVELLKDPEDNTRANSAGALGNFVRCSDYLCNDIIKCKAHEALLNLAENEDPQQIQIIRVALFALGNFCNHSVIKTELDKINFKDRIEALKIKYKNDNQLNEHIERIKKKLKDNTKH